MRKLSYLTLLLIFVILNNACAQDAMVQSVTFKSNTRGGQKMITVNKSTISCANGGNSNEYELETSDWEELTKTTSNIKLSQMESFDPPSSGRASDAAWHSTVTVVTEDGSEYSSTYFDNAKAPKELMSLMEILIKLDLKYNKDNQVIDF